MKNILSSFTSLAFVSILFFACNKVDHKDLFTPYVAPSKPFSPISDSTCLSGTLNGTLVAGKTYKVCGNIIINDKDTLIIQPGVTIKFEGNYGIGVKGSLFSLGTQANPILFTYDSTTLVKTDAIGAPVANDPAFKGLWTGIIGGPACPFMIIKWTKVEFGGGKPNGTVAAVGGSGYPLYFQNPTGIFVLEDSWIYGSVDDPLRTFGGKVAIIRNTFEKCGLTGGEAFNAKAGTIGDFAYNLCVGMATNGGKLSNSGVAVGVAATEVRMYNNTVINSGYRRSSAGRGGSFNFEQNAAGFAYNNLIVNCKFGPRVVQSPLADTAHIRYGYNFQYGDSLSVVRQFVPNLKLSTAITAPQSTDIPNIIPLLPTGWKIGDSLSNAIVAPLMGTNNPLFVNGPVPMPAGANLQDIAVVGSYSFRLKASSPCIGKGFTGFTPKGDVPVDAKYGVTELTPPGKDMGAFQYNGTGNQH